MGTAKPRRNSGKNRNSQNRGGPKSNASNHRSLRIGVILGGKIVEEKLIRKREQITIGQSVKNTFSVPVEGMPRSWPLFLVKEDKFYLHFSESMDGRISDGSSVQPLQSLKQSGARRHAEGWVIPLPETSRGKVVLGDMTLLFQFVTAPPLQPRPHLPASVRGSLADRIDPHLAIITAISLIAHLSIMVYARSCHDRRVPRVEALYQETFPDEYEESFDQPKAVQVDVATNDKGEGDKKPEDKGDKKPKDKSSKKPEKGGDKGPKDKGSARPEKSDEEMQADADIAIAGMFGDDSATASSEGTRMRDRNPGNDLADEAKMVDEGRAKVTLKDTGSDQGPTRGRRRRATGTGPNIKTGKGREGSGEVGPAKVPKKPQVKIIKPDVDESTTLTPGAIMAKIRRQYTYGLKQCFKKVLKIDETASGTLKLKFTIGERGGVTRADTRGFGYDTLDKCVKAQALKWRFKPPKDEDGDATEMTVKISLPFTGR